ncbi:RNA methyltransferase, RsmE family [Halobacteroides halobius DSM 5150]|uniref:Ribosomal RNA small subunit methyltransferase E n=1 Tax=Halobacteroides halobius (strain ATCC 35273 / DSM 5150 / MD-1) TaxID=748449 RepID=L0K9Y6_HALHC|nr:16S rRNA (uracil(1498)-N(3))-methyltransferase [Halobacteroides halobius]AGB41806.1 RNA methyltransferase, RsmE family [Halobacteroides halobius DSM 5150]
MNHFFVTPKDIREDQVLITGSDVGHITRSLRLSAKDKITVADGEGNKYLVELIRTTNEVVEGQIIEEIERKVESTVEITLIQGVPKRKKKMDLIVQKCTELGIDKIIPIITERTVVKLTDKKANKRQDRWQKIALEAAKQSRRAKVPTIAKIKDFAQMPAVASDDLALIPWEDEDTTGIKEVMQEQNVSKVVILIGPEGGFSQSEVNQAKKIGFKPVSLGARILRTETAGITAVALAQYELGDLGAMKQLINS